MSYTCLFKREDNVWWISGPGSWPFVSKLPNDYCSMERLLGKYCHCAFKTSLAEWGYTKRGNLMSTGSAAMSERTGIRSRSLAGSGYGRVPGAFSLFGRKALSSACVKVSQAHFLDGALSPRSKGSHLEDEKEPDAGSGSGGRGGCVPGVGGCKAESGACLLQFGGEVARVHEHLEQ
ncbi:hypothetical protein AOLI_G00101340 [Acnodon oligacanthus]